MMDNKQLVDTIKATMNDMNHAEEFAVRVASIAQFKYNAETWMGSLLAERAQMVKVIEAAEALVNTPTPPLDDLHSWFDASRIALVRDLQAKLAALDAAEG